MEDHSGHYLSYHRLNFQYHFVISSQDMGLLSNHFLDCRRLYH